MQSTVRIEDRFDLPDPPVEVEALIPWSRGDLVATLYREAEVLSAEAEPDGTRVHARVDLRELAAVRPYLTKSVTQRLSDAAKD